MPGFRPEPRWFGAVLAAAAFAATPGLRAQTSPPPAAPTGEAAAKQASTFKPEELEALVAPIALYPDSLLSQVLMASTYPLEIVKAARWVKANPNVKGDAAVKAVANETWDVSVKSMVAFPQILEPLNDKLDWTQKLGDAFLAQQKDVLDAVQRMRAKAQQSGNLKSNEQQKVITEPAPAGATQQTIVKIEPASPEVIYVPAYNPTVVYGGWAYPSYPPYYWPPYPAYYPGAALASGFAWGVGFAAAGAIFGNCNWGGGDVNINVNKAVNIDRNFDKTKINNNGSWKHDAGHRGGVAYRDNATRERYGKSSSGAAGRNEYRGRDNAGVSDRGAGNRGGAGGDRGAGAGDRGGLGTADRGGAGAGNRGASDRSAGAGNRAGGGGDHAFQGVGGGSASQRDFDRGHSTAQRSSANRPTGGGGGGARGGHGGGGGGRRR
jgi:hypothetical protein